MTDYKVLWQQMCERCDDLDKRLAQLEYKLTSDNQLMENAQGELERIKLVQTGVGIEQRAEEAYEAAKQRSWIGVSDEVAQPEPLPWTNKMSIYVPNQPLYTAPHTWVGLTDTEIKLQWSEFWETDCHAWSIEFAKAIEAKLKEKNT